MSRILFIGGPGNISTSAIQELLGWGHEVAVFTLPGSPTHGLERSVRFYNGNRDHADEVSRAVADFGPDITADVCCFTPAQAEGLIGVLRGKGIRHVFVSTVDVYGYPLARLPFEETDGFRPPVSKYAADKIACERLFWAEHHAGTIPLSVVRPSYSFGPPFVLSLFSRRGGLELVARLRAGKPVVVPGDGQTLIHPSNAFNTGRMLAHVVASEAAVGQDYTCAHATFMTADEYYRLFARVLEVEPLIVHMPTEWLLPLEMKVIPDNLLSELTRFHIAFSVGKFLRHFPAFAWQKSLEEAAREYIEFHDRAGDIPPSADGFEDQLVRAWETARRHFVP